MLREISPNLRHVAEVLDPTFTGFSAVWESSSFRARGDDLETALAAFAQEPGGALIVLPAAINSMARSCLFAAAAARQRLPIAG